jgi:nucleotide-binding universal stress UspA family protein
MTYRSVFVHVDDAEPCERRLEVAARLARTYPAQLLGAYIVPSSDMTPFRSALLPQDIVQQRMGQVAELQRRAETRFRAAAAGVTSLVWHAPSGDPMESAVLHARYADLAVIGQPARDEPNLAFATELANAVVMGSGRPVLFVPSAGTYATVGERVMIAWKDSRESARAVADALPLLKDAKKVYAVAITPDADDSLQDLLSDRHAAAFLRRHEVDAKVRRLAAPDIDAGEMLLNEAADFGADLIVMGAYSRPRITALVWGSVTQVMLKSMTVPVLMSH